MAECATLKDGVDDLLLSYGQCLPAANVERNRNHSQIGIVIAAYGCLIGNRSIFSLSHVDQRPPLRVVAVSLSRAVGRTVDATGPASSDPNSLGPLGASSDPNSLGPLGDPIPWSDARVVR